MDVAFSSRRGSTRHPSVIAFAHQNISIFDMRVESILLAHGAILGLCLAADALIIYRPLISARSGRIVGLE